MRWQRLVFRSDATVQTGRPLRATTTRFPWQSISLLPSVKPFAIRSRGQRSQFNQRRYSGSASNWSLTATVVDSFIRQNNRAVCLSLHRRCATRTTSVDHIARIERRRLPLIVARIPLASVQITVKLPVVDSEIVPVARLHSADQVKVSSERLTLEVKHV